MTTKEIKEKIQHSADVVSFSKGVFTAKKSYFWGITNDGSGFADKIVSLIPGARMIEYGNHYHDFVGGAKTGGSKDSYFYVQFEVK